jgi:F5/8 type C domain/Carbohydrate binding domain (family 11)
MIARWVGVLCLLACSTAAAQTRMLEDFENLSNWHAEHTDDVVATLGNTPGHDGQAMRLQLDFAGVNGYATARRKLPLDLPDNFELSFWIRGEAGVNTLQFKLVDDSGENVWWINRPDFTFPREWQQIRIKKRQIDFAWGPTRDRSLKHIASIEFVVSTGRDGGKGHVDFDQLELHALPPPDANPPQPVVTASSSQENSSPNAAMDGDPGTMWSSKVVQGSEQHLDIDFLKPREFGGLTLQWAPNEAAVDYDVQFSDDGQTWRTVRSVRNGDGGSDSLMLGESETRYLRLNLRQGQTGIYALREITVEPIEFGASANSFFSAIARRAARGSFPRGFTEQPYWTIVGVDGVGAPALMSEDGALEPRKGGFSIEPFLIIGDKRVTWADVAPTQSLLDDELPMPSVVWKSGNVELTVDAFARGTRENSTLLARYRVKNTGDQPQTVTLALVIRPFQVNPPAQFLNSAGGASPIHDLAESNGVVSINGKPAVLALTHADSFAASSFDSGFIVDRLRDGSKPESSVHDDVGFASGALMYPMTLAPNAEREVDLAAPTTGPWPSITQRDAKAVSWIAHERDAAAKEWHAKIDRVSITVPAAGQRLVKALRTSTAYTLISRDGPALRPGTRSYARSWIRDGAMIEDGLLSLGNIEAAREFVDWYAPHQFSNGKVPCCVDHRGSDPVPENDSHGELIHAIAQLYRYGGDRAELEKNWPHISNAIAYMETLRASETGANDPAFRGMMPASISHEGYSSKPMHSYWDDLWSLVGYKDAADMAAALGRSEDATRISKLRDAFRADLLASIAATVKAHAIDYMPGCAELGDFDATSSTIAIAQAGELDALSNLLHATFERYWREFQSRADGSRAWKDYTPYEWRTVGAFARLGWRDRAHAAIDFFFRSGARPAAWNQWAEVVGSDAREIRFIGDMPHIWVASDFIRSTLDLFAYDRASDHALVIGAGLPASWIASKEGVAIAGLRTPYGALSYRVRKDNDRVTLHIDKGIAPPGGFVFASPFESMRNTRVNGQTTPWTGNLLKITAAPADVAFDVAPSPTSH